MLQVRNNETVQAVGKHIYLMKKLADTQTWYGYENGEEHTAKTCIKFYADN